MKKLYYIFTTLFIFINQSYSNIDFVKEAQKELADITMQKAVWAMNQEPKTITSVSCQRSAGGKNDFYSEGDYWWENPNDPDGPYINKDGQSNPNNFIEHRLLMVDFSKIVASLASAYLVTNDHKYVKKAFEHINAWFVNEETKMNPNLLYAQAIKGISTGRSIGVIDSIHLIEVAQSIMVMQGSNEVDNYTLKKSKDWFCEYIKWLKTHPYGIKEMEARNNHGTTWLMQVASFAKLVGDEDTLAFCKNRYRLLLENQMIEDGSFPIETRRTKPYGYSLFNLDAFATICQILSDDRDNLWVYTTPKKQNIKLAIDFMYPYVKDKSKWIFNQDIMYWENWPMAHPAFLFGAIAFNNSNYFKEWKNKPHTSDVVEVQRNLPVRNPLIWIK